MKHIEHYQSFNETIIPTSLDNIARNIFNRIKGTPFNMNDYTFRSDDYYDIITYKVEESDTPLGYINLIIKRDTDNFIPAVFPDYYLKLDGEEIRCFIGIKRKIYWYLYNKGHQIESRKEKNARIKNKFKAFESDEYEFDIENQFNNSTYEEKIRILVDNFGLSERESYEICDDDTTFDELPDEIKFNDDFMHDVFGRPNPYVDDYSSVETDEELIIKSFEAEYGTGPTTVKQRLDFANYLSNEGEYSKELIMSVLKNKKN